MEVIRKSALLIFASLLLSHLSYGQMNYEVTIDCDTAVDINESSVFCSVKGTMQSSFNYSDSISDLHPDVTVTFKIDSSCNKTVIKTEILNKFKYSNVQLNYISKYYENLVKNANIVYRTSDKKSLECKVIAARNFPMRIKFNWR